MGRNVFLNATTTWPKPVWFETYWTLILNGLISLTWLLILFTTWEPQSCDQCLGDAIVNSQPLNNFQLSLSRDNLCLSVSVILLDSIGGNPYYIPISEYYSCEWPDVFKNLCIISACIGTDKQIKNRSFLSILVCGTISCCQWQYKKAYLYQFSGKTVK